MKQDADEVPLLVPVVSNLTELLTTCADRQPDQVALIDTGSSGEADRLTWAELERRVDALAGGLTALGLVGGQRLGLIGSNSIAFVVGYLAALRAGLVAVPVDPGASDAELSAHLASCGAHYVLSDDPGRALAGTVVLALRGDGLEQLAAAGHSPVATPPDPEALAVLATTAGTSGEPKIAMVSHRALLAHLDAVGAYGLADRNTVVLGALPFSHLFGLNTVLGGWISAGARLVICAPATSAVLGAVAGHGVTMVPTTPRLLFDLLSEPDLRDRLAGVRTVLCAAAPVPWRLARDFTERTGLRVERGYGLTEAGPGISATLGHEILGPAHVGRALPGVQIRVAPTVEVGEPGPILIRGRNLFGGYWPDGRGGPGEDGWFDTGDIGYLTGPDLFLIDRARELVVVNGFTVYPTEVEQAVRELVGVTAAAAVGVTVPGGVQLMIFVAGDVTVDDVRAHCARRLAPFKRPEAVRIVDDLPRSVTGKIRRAELRRWAQSD